VREDESYRWPKRCDDYEPYRVFIGRTRGEGAVQIGLGETIRENAWGRHRKYVVAFLSGGSPQNPLVEFVATDDFEDTRELVAVIRGSARGRHRRDAQPRADPEPPSLPHVGRGVEWSAGTSPLLRKRSERSAVLRTCCLAPADTFSFEER